MAANPCADQIPASVSSSFSSSGFGSAGSTQNHPSATKTQQKNGELWKQQQQQQHCINAGLEQDELELERLASCCWGRLDSRLSLQLLVLLNFLLDGVSAWLSLEHMFASYLFAGAALLSLLSVCAVLNGLQEEKKTMVKGTAMLAGIKAVVLSALTLTAVAAFVEEQSTNEQFRPSLELRALLFCVLPLFVCSLSAQYRLSQRVVAWLRLKDQLYVISAPLGDYCQLRGRSLTTTTTMTGRGSWKRRVLNPSSREQMGGGVKC